MTYYDYLASFFVTIVFYYLLSWLFAPTGLWWFFYGVIAFPLWYIMIDVTSSWLNNNG
jgi:hypothetical protein